jgi:hypothetical protein
MSYSTGSRYIDRSLRPGWFIYWQSQVYRILSYDKSDPNTIVAQNVAAGETAILTLLEILRPESDQLEPLFASTQEALYMEIERRCPPPESATAIGLPDYAVRTADRIIATLEQVDKVLSEAERMATLRGEEFKRTDQIKRACEICKIGLTSYYKYRKVYRRYGGNRAQIAASLRRHTFNQTRMDKAQLHFMDTMIMRYYARQNCPRPATVYRLAQGILERTGDRWIDPDRCKGNVPQDLIGELLDTRLPMQVILDNPEKAHLLQPVILPSPAWFYGYLRWFETQPDKGKTVMNNRHGRGAWENELMVFDTFVNRATLPLQYVFADHWLVDVFIVDEATRNRMSRLWLSLAIDAFSRSVLGLALYYQPPCIDSIQGLLKHAIWPKTTHTELGIAGEWPCFGIPQQLFLDNAWAHHSFSLENLARAISRNGQFNSIDLDFRPPYKGRYGALIERMFGNLSSQVKQLLPGAIQSNGSQDIRNAAREACLLYQDMYKILHRIIVDYQHTPHHELGGMTPHQKWLEGLRSGLPLMPPLTMEMERLFWRMSPNSRVITSKGICAFGMHYSSPELTGALQRRPDGKRYEYSFSYDSANISTLALFRDGKWVCDVWAKELRLADGSYRPVSLWEREMARDMAADDHLAAQDWTEYLDEISELTKLRRAEQKSAQQGSPKPKAGKPSVAQVRATEKAIEDLAADETDDRYTTMLAGFVGKESD